MKPETNINTENGMPKYENPPIPPRKAISREEWTSMSASEQLAAFEKPMKKETAYISGKISGLPDLNIPKFQKAEAKVIQIGFNPCNPHKLPDNHDKKWNSYMKVCLSHLHACDLVVALDDWNKSRGAIVEIWNAEWVDIPVFDLETMRPIKLTFWIKVKLLLNLI